MHELLLRAEPLRDGIELPLQGQLRAPRGAQEGHRLWRDGDARRNARAAGGEAQRLACAQDPARGVPKCPRARPTPAIAPVPDPPLKRSGGKRSCGHLRSSPLHARLPDPRERSSSIGGGCHLQHGRAPPVCAPGCPAPPA